MRLIDADELKIEFKDCIFSDSMINPLMRYTDIIETIDNQPTVYDIDKVVEELEKMTRGVGTTINDNCVIGVRRGYEKASRKAIEIVKRGGKNDD